MTYRTLGERLRRGEEGRAALRCVVAERSTLETAATTLSPRTIDFDTCSYDELAEYALPSERREMWVSLFKLSNFIFVPWLYSFYSGLVRKANRTLVTLLTY